jgi:23S rRNA (guanosine2251-2'-O)-methyltransferase
MRKLHGDELGRLSVAQCKVLPRFPIVVVLENIRSAYNVGSVFRSADAFFIESIYLVGYCAKPPHKEIAKTALGAELAVPWKHTEKASEAVQELQAMGYKVLAAEQTDASIPLQQVTTLSDQKVAIVFGNEVTGVEAETLGFCDGCIEIPQFGMKHSLNIATAAGVVLWELVRHHLQTSSIPDAKTN